MSNKCKLPDTFKKCYISLYFHKTERRMPGIPMLRGGSYGTEGQQRVELMARGSNLPVDSGFLSCSATSSSFSPSPSSSVGTSRAWGAQGLRCCALQSQAHTTASWPPAPARRPHTWPRPSCIFHVVQSCVALKCTVRVQLTRCRRTHRRHTQSLLCSQGCIGPQILIQV